MSKPVWNKGKTAATDPRVAAYGKKGGETRKGHTPWNKGLTAQEDPRVPSGDRFAHRPPPTNKGKIIAEVPRYEAVHYRLNRLRTGTCMNCNRMGKTHMALIRGRGTLTNANGPRAGLLFSNDLEDYWELCPKCHAHYDRGLL